MSGGESRATTMRAGSKGTARHLCLWASVGSLLAGSVGCGAPPPPDDARLLADLAAELPVAEVRRERPALDLGTSGARSHLLGGWSWDETSPDGGPGEGRDRTFVWGVGDASELDLFLTAPRALELRLRGRPFQPEGAPQQTVVVEANGNEVGRWVLAPGSATYRATLPEEVLEAGMNRLTLRYGGIRSPASLGRSKDARPLAVAWSALRLEPVPPASGEVAARRTEGGTEVLELPVGSAVDYFLELPAPAGSETLLAAESVRSGVGAPGALLVEIQEEGEEAVRVAAVGPAPGSGGRLLLRLPLAPGGPERRLVRLALRAVPEEPGAEGSLLLTAPRLLTSAPPAEPTEAGPALEPAGAAGRPNVVVFLVDTLRADRVGVYGGVGARRLLTPRIDAFAAGALVFTDVVAEAPWTRPTVASLLTGLAPTVHGVTGLVDRLAAEAVTLPELFRDAGYRTAAVSTNWHVTEATGMAQGFDEFLFDPEAVHAEEVVGHAVAWLGRHRAERPKVPFFLYLHALDPHAPYRPPAPYRERLAPGAPPDAGSRPYLERIYAAEDPHRRAELMRPIPSLYDAEVAATDTAFGALVDALGERGLGESTVIAFVSDHGEGLDEHGHLGHGHDLHAEALQVPMILRLPGGMGGGRWERTVQPSDLFPMLLAAAGIAPPFRPAAAATAPASTVGPAFSHLAYEGRRGASVVLGEWKAIEPLSAAFGRRPELYHRGRDPGERLDLAGRHPVRLGYLRSLIRRHLLRGQDPALSGTAAIDAATRRGLEALGYL